MKMSEPLVIATRIAAIIVGLCMVIVGILIFTHFAQVKQLSVLLQPGIFGGALLLLLNILYLPNAAMALASYIAGSGFAVGTGTLISPWWYHSDQIPVLPTHRHPLMIVSALFFVAIGALLVYWTIQSGITVLLQSGIFLSVMLVLLAYLSSGSLMTDEMGSFGLSVWKFGLAAILEIAIGAITTTFILARTKR
jgi:hypothetical protein